MPTVLITGTSSGYGLAAVEHFLRQGWRVIATMRTPDPRLFRPSGQLRVLALDVTDEASICLLYTSIMVRTQGVAVFPVASIR